jgi:kinetochor protein Mis14/NSL1
MSTSTSNPSRKIDIQSPSDLTHLINIAHAASDSKLAAAFPVSASEDADNPDGMRAQVAALLEKFLDETYAGVKKNVLVNGVAADGSGAGQDGDGDVTMMEGDYETFDTTLAERIRSLEERKEELTEKIAGWRRTGPSQAAEKWRADWEAQQEVDGMKREEAPGGAEVPELLDVEHLARWDEVQKTYSRALDGLLALKTGMAGTVGNLEEAKRVSESLHSNP